MPQRTGMSSLSVPGEALGFRQDDHHRLIPFDAHAGSVASVAPCGLAVSGEFPGAETYPACAVTAAPWAL